MQVPAHSIAFVICTHRLRVNFDAGGCSTGGMIEILGCKIGGSFFGAVGDWVLQLGAAISCSLLRDPPVLRNTQVSLESHSKPG